jgi:long-chain acyl-CoA synthetase
VQWTPDQQRTANALRSVRGTLHPTSQNKQTPMTHPSIHARTQPDKIAYQVAAQIGTVYFADRPEFSYHNDPEKTKRAYNARGWSTLGDVGYLDDEGFLYLTDRRSYMIISGGVNIYPQETEDVLITHPEIADVAVFGVPNEEMGEEVKAVVQPHDMARAGKELEAELISFCRTHLSPIKCPRSIDFEAELPRTPTGKLVKRHLRDRYWPNAVCA